MRSVLTALADCVAFEKAAWRLSWPSVVVSLVLGLGTLCALAVHPANAQAILPQSTAAAGPAYSFEMPIGKDELAIQGVVFNAGGMIRLSAPPTDLELKRLKSLPRRPAVAGETLLLPTGGLPSTSSGLDPRGVSAVVTECNTDVGADIAGAAGTTNIVVTTDDAIGVYGSASCALVSRVTYSTFFSSFSPPGTQTFTTPRVLFDPAVDRFFLSVKTLDAFWPLVTDQYLYLAVSKDGTGTNWWVYRFVLSEGTTRLCNSAENPRFNFINVGYNASRWFITVNEWPLLIPFSQSADLMSIEKSPSLVGASVEMRCFTGLRVNLAPPLVRDSGSDAYFASVGRNSGSTISIYKLAPSGSGSGMSDQLSQQSSIVVGDWSAPPDALQPNGFALDTTDGGFFTPSTQIGEDLWNVHTVNVEGFARWRLYKLSIADALALFEFSPTTTGNDSLFNPSVAVTSNAPNSPAFVTASRTIQSDPSDGNPSVLMFNGASDSINGWGLLPLAKSDFQFVGCNILCYWAYYSATQIDPSNDQQAWGFSELVVGPENDNKSATKGFLVSAGALPPPPAPTCEIIADPVTIAERGDLVRITWTSHYANWVDFNAPYFGTHLEANSFSARQDDPRGATTYTGTFVGPGGQTVCSAKVTIGATDPLTLLGLGGLGGAAFFGRRNRRCLTASP